MHRFLRSTIASLLAFALLLLALAPVAAGKPDRAFAPSPTDVTLSGYCGFDVRVQVVANNEYTTTFYDRDGNVTRTHIAGRFVVLLTNVATGKTMQLQASGPGSFIADATGLTLEARGTWFFFFAGELFVTSGHSVLRVDAAGETIVDLRGRTLDVCQLLSS